jgi:branched-chain amino acid transport system substrate-binding protein
MLGQAEGVVLRDLARRYPKVVFLLGNSYAQEPTLRNPAPNLFRFVSDGAQAIAGLGSYAYRRLDWRTAAVVLPDDTYAWPEAAGFLAEFCALGGRVQRVVAPPSGAAGALARLPKDADGVVLLSRSFPETAAFAGGYAKLRPDLSRHLVLGPGSMAFLDPKLFGQVALLLRGVVLSGGSYDSRDPVWVAFRTAFRQHFPGLSDPLNPAGFPLVLGYYDSVEATLRALEQAPGGGLPLMRTLARTNFDSPNGPLRLDRNRQAVVSAVLSQIEEGGRIRTIRVLHGVEQTFGGYFSASTPTPTVSRPGCHAATPPPWGR